MLTVYSKDACPACNKAINELTKHNVAFNVIKIVTDNPLENQITRDSFMEQFPGIKVVPYIVGENIVLKSFDELKTYIEQTTN